MMPLLKIDEDLNKKNNPSNEKLSLLIQLNNSYFVGCDVSVQLLQSNLAVISFKVQEKSWEESGTKYPENVYRQAEEAES